MKILHYIPGFNTGGIESVFLNWYRNLKDSDTQFELLVRNYDPDSPMIQEYLTSGGILHTLETPSLNPKTMIHFRKKVKAFFKQHNQYDFLHVHVADDPFVISAAKQAGIHEIGIHAHTTGYNESYKSKGLKGLIRSHNVKQAKRYFACSHEAAKWMFPDYISHVKIIHNGIDTKRYEFDPEIRQTYREKLGLADAFTLVHVGRFSEVKNHPLLVEMFSRLLKFESNVKLLFVGEGPLYAEYKEKYKHSNILFLGARKDIPEILQAADVFLLPSKFEGLGMAAIEAQGAGLPTVVSDRVPDEAKITELVHFLPLEDSVEQWVQQILALKGSQRESTVEQLIKAHYDIKQTTNDLIQYYKQVGE